MSHTHMHILYIHADTIIVPFVCGEASKNGKNEDKQTLYDQANRKKKLSYC